MAFAGWNPGIGSTGSPARCSVSPMWAYYIGLSRQNHAWIMLITFWRFLHVTSDVTDLAWPKACCRDLFWMHDAQFSHLIFLTSIAWSNSIACGEGLSTHNQAIETGLHAFPKDTFLNIDQWNYSSVTVVSKTMIYTLPIWCIVTTYKESNKNALRGAVILPLGGGIRATMALRTSSTPCPVFADTWRTSAGSIPNVDCICVIIRSGCAAGKSIYIVRKWEEECPRWYQGCERPCSGVE
jgi:hypothetical protein